MITSGHQLINIEFCGFDHRYKTYSTIHAQSCQPDTEIPCYVCWGAVFCTCSNLLKYVCMNKRFCFWRIISYFLSVVFKQDRDALW